MTVFTTVPASTETLNELGTIGLAPGLAGLDSAISSGSDPGHTHTLVAGATDVTATYTELNQLAGVTVGGTSSGDIVDINTAQTITNKRITRRVSTEASSATPTINTDNVEMHTITALATNITSMTTNLSGTPNNGDILIIRILDDGTARSITWGASFVSRGVTLPPTTVISKYLYVFLIWNSTTSTWDCISKSLEV